MYTQYRFYIFIFSLILFCFLEFIFSYRQRNLKRLSRWPHNFLLLLIGSFLVKLLFPLGLFWISEVAERNQFGIFHFFKIPLYIEVFFSLIIFDFSIYLQHVLFHKIPFLWKLHRVHHSDPDLDSTSALRFHPLEMILSFFYKSLWVLVLGVSYESIFVFEVLLNFMAMFNHSNLALPKKFEAFLRIFLVTPQMHIIHHSINRDESERNYSFNLSVWDRIFNTYQKQFSSAGAIGTLEFNSKEDQSILRLLIQPFR